MLLLGLAVQVANLTLAALLVFLVSVVAIGGVLLAIAELAMYLEPVEAEDQGVRGQARDDDQGVLRVRRWNAESHAFDPSPWPAVLEPERVGLERELTLLRSGQPPERRSPFRGENALVISPIRNGPGAGLDPGQARPAPVFGFTVLELDMDYVRDEMLPDLAVRHLSEDSPVC